MATNQAAPFRPSFVPLFDEGSTGGPQRKAPVSLGASEKHRLNRAELSMKPQNSGGTGGSVVQPSASVAPTRDHVAAHAASGCSSSPSQARVVDHNIDEVEKRMMADQARVAQGHPPAGPDVFDAEYERIVADTSRRQLAAQPARHQPSANEDEFDF